MLEGCGIVPHRLRVVVQWALLLETCVLRPPVLPARDWGGSETGAPFPRALGQVRGEGPGGTQDLAGCGSAWKPRPERPARPQKPALPPGNHQRAPRTHRAGADPQGAVCVFPAPSRDSAPLSRLSDAPWFASLWLAAASSGQDRSPLAFAWRGAILGCWFGAAKGPTHRQRKASPREAVRGIGQCWLH